MNLFNSVKDHILKASESNEHKFQQSDTFKGYKRVHLSTYGYEPVQKGLKAVRKRNPEYFPGKDEPKYIYDFAGKTITIKKSYYQAQDFCFQIMVDKNHVGTIFPDQDNKNITSAIDSDKVESVYLKIDPDQEYNAKKNKVVYSDERVTAFLFVKLRK